TPDFDATAYHHVPTVTFASAVHVAVVDVDRETGAVKLVRYVVAHDCGKVINPIIVDGQVHGGVAQGVGGALFEDMADDAEEPTLGAGCGGRQPAQGRDALGGRGVRAEVARQRIAAVLALVLRQLVEERDHPLRVDARLL